MTQELLNAILLVFGAGIGGIVVGGATVMIVYDRVVKSVLNSPVIIESLRGAFASLPAPIQEAARDTVALEDKVVAQQAVTLQPTPPGMAANIPITDGAAL